MCHRQLLVYFCDFCFVCCCFGWGFWGVFLGNDLKKAEILPERIRK